MTLLSSTDTDRIFLIEFGSEGGENSVRIHGKFCRNSSEILKFERDSTFSYVLRVILIRGAADRVPPLARGRAFTLIDAVQVEHLLVEVEVVLFERRVRNRGRIACSSNSFAGDDNFSDKSAKMSIGRDPNQSERRGRPYHLRGTIIEPNMEPVIGTTGNSPVRSV